MGVDAEASTVLITMVSRVFGGRDSRTPLAKNCLKTTELFKKAVAIDKTVMPKNDSLNVARTALQKQMLF